MNEELHALAISNFQATYDDFIAGKDNQINVLTQHADVLRTQLDNLTMEIADLEGSLETEVGRVQELNAEVARLQARIAELEAGNPDPEPDGFLRSYDTLAEFLDDNPQYPKDANYVEWKPGNPEDLEKFAATLPVDAVIVYPRGKKLVQFDSSRGFTATRDAVEREYISDADYEARGYSEKYVTGWVKVEQNPRTWFAMVRVGRGIIGLDKDLVIEPTDSGWKGFRQTKNNYAVKSATGSVSPKIGVQEKLIEHGHHSPIFSNFTLRSRQFGTVAYSGLAATGKAQNGVQGKATVSRIVFDQAHWGFAGIPNGETGGLVLGGNEYDVRDVKVIPNPSGATSPIMLNRAMKGYMENADIGQHEIGMLTFWKCGGAHVLKNVVTRGNRIGVNLEEEIAGFTLNWDGGAMLLKAKGDAFHLNTNATPGPMEVHLRGVAVSGYYGPATNEGKLMAHLYGTGKLSKRAITWDGGEILYLPASNYTP